MKWLDKKLQDFRISQAKKFIRKGDTILDIGSSDGKLFKQCADLIKFGYGIDPTLPALVETQTYTLVPGYFPKDCLPGIQYNAITMLAVLEHIPEAEQKALADNCLKYLAPNGRVIITVPSPIVDDILDVLLKLKLIDGMSLEEHYGFEVENTEQIFKTGFRLLHKSKFQLGVNNLFVFEQV